MKRLVGRSKWLIGEITVIVLGVLIALGIDAWYGVVLERQAEQTYLEQLIEDLESTEAQMAEAGVRTARSEESAQLLAEHVRATPLNADSIRVWLAEIQRVDNPVPVLGTAEALVATGDLRIIDNSEARAAITRWLSRSRDFWLVPVYQLEEQHKSTLTQLLHAADRAGIEPDGRGGGVILPQERSRDRPPFVTHVAMFRDDPIVHSLLADLVGEKNGMAAYRASMAREAAELRGTLEPLLRKR